MDGLLDQIDLENAPAIDFNPYEIEPAWRDFPCEWKRPRFAHVPHEIDWVKLYELRRQRQHISTTAKSGNEVTSPGTLHPQSGGK